MSSNYFYIFVILLGFALLYLVTIYIQTLFAFKKNYSEYKCNPLMMPFSGSFGENPIDVFNECVEAQQSATTEKYASNIFSNLENSNSNVSNINSMNVGLIENQAQYKNTMLGTDNLGDKDDESKTGIMPKMGNTQKAISIQTTKLAVASKAVTDTIMANIKGVLLMLEGAPIAIEGIFNSPPIQMVMNVGALAGN